MAELSVEISAKIDRLLSELGKAKKALGGIGTATERLTEKLKKAGEKMGRIGKSMTTYLTLPLAAIAGASIKMASDFTESLNKVDVAFKGSSKEVRKFAETTLETFGIAEGTALDMAALFGDMGTSMGVPTDKAADLATAMVGLAGDMSSFKNIGIKEVTTALNGVFTGETESLKRMGIVMTIANLKAFALTRGMSDNIEAMTQAQKVQLRYAYILSVTKNAQGDFARTSDQSANQMRIFSESVKELSVAFGEILLPYFTKAITYVNKVVKAFVNLSPATKKIIVVVAGLVAVLGPLLIGLGFLATSVVPGLISVVGFLSTSFATLTATMAANPFGLLAVAIAAVVSYFVFFNDEVEKTIKKQSTLASITDKATKSISKERANLASLLAIARHEGVSKKQRLKAISEINRISPKYLGNIKLETINTDAARVAIENYNKHLIQSATIKAAQVKLQAIQAKKIEIEVSQAKKLVKDAAKLIKLKEDAVTIEDRLRVRNLERIGFGETSNGLQAAQLKGLQDEEDILLKIIAAHATKNDVVASGGSTKLRKKATGINTEGLASGFSFADDNLSLMPRVNSTQFDEDAAAMILKAQEFSDGVSGILQNGVLSTFEQLGNNIGMALANGGNVIQAFMGSILGAMGSTLQKYGSLVVAAGIASEAFKESMKNPFGGGIGAIIAGTALIAIGGAVKSFSGSLGKGSSGGGGGNSSSGAGASNFSGSSGGGNFGASSGGGMQNVVFEIQGTKLVGVLSNTLSRNRSLGGSLSLT